MKEQIEKVRIFREAFNLGINKSPTVLSLKDDTLHYKMLLEELEEFLTATINDDLVEIADALADIQYLILGAVLHYGFADKFEAIFNEVQKSNMSKLDENGKPLLREDGKVIKSTLFQKPDLNKILNQ